MANYFNMSFGRTTPGVWYERLVAYIWYDGLCALWLLGISFYLDFFVGRVVLPVKDIERRSGHVAVITGGPQGLALGLITRLLQLDYTVFMGERNIHESYRRLHEFGKSNPQLPINNVKILQLDLMSLESTRMFAEELKKRVTRIDLLLCNAGIMNTPYKLTEDGYESQFQVNYLSQFLLTQLLLEKIKETAVWKGSPCQIINTTSLAHEGGKFDFEDLENPRVYTPTKYYYVSKLCQATFMLHLNKKLKGQKAQVYCYAVHPGAIPTGLWDDVFPLAKLVGTLLRPLLRTVQHGADVILWPVFAPEFQNGGGLYMANGKIRKANMEARNETNQVKLYLKSLKLIKAQIGR